MMPMLVSWFSAGVSSAVATWFAIKEIDKIIYQHIDDQHSDTLRFVKDCESWFGKPIEILQVATKLLDNYAEAECRSAVSRAYYAAYHYGIQVIEIKLPTTNNMIFK